MRIRTRYGSHGSRGMMVSVNRDFALRVYLIEMVKLPYCMV